MEYNSKKLKEENFPLHLERAMEAFDTEKVLQDGFRSCSILPLNAFAVSYSKIKEDISITTSETNEKQDEK